MASMTGDWESVITLKDRAPHLTPWLLCVSWSVCPCAQLAVISSGYRCVEMSKLLNCHCTQCQWLCTLECGQSDGHCMLIHHCTKFLFSYPKQPRINCLLCYTKNYIRPLPTYLIFLLHKHSFIQNATKKKSSNVSGRIDFKKSPHFFL